MKTVLALLLAAVSLGAVAGTAEAGWSGSGGIQVERDEALDVGRIGGDRIGGERREAVRIGGGERPAAARDILPERRIARILRRSGFAGIEEIRLRRDRYVVTAVRPNGAVFRLAMDASDGDILGSERIGWSRGYDRRDYDRYRKGHGGRPTDGFPFRLGFGG